MCHCFQTQSFVNWLEISNFMEATIVTTASSGSEPRKEWISSSESQPGMVCSYKLACHKRDAFSSEKLTVAWYKVVWWAILVIFCSFLERTMCGLSKVCVMCVWCTVCLYDIFVVCICINYGVCVMSICVFVWCICVWCVINVHFVYVMFTSVCFVIHLRCVCMWYCLCICVWVHACSMWFCVYVHVVCICVVMFECTYMSICTQYVVL